MRILVLLVCFALWGSLAAADLPLGEVTGVDGDRIEVRFDQDSELAPDDMLALYGPGKVEKHPLTGQVTIEQRKLVAKVHVLESDGRTLVCRVTWLAPEVSVEAGYDAVPLPGDASPDAPPVQSEAMLPEFSVEQQGLLRIAVPVHDPEGGGLACRWQLLGQSGENGRLLAKSTALPEVAWIAPALEGAYEVQLTVSDRAGQELELTVPLNVDAMQDGWRQRVLTPFARLGAGREALRSLQRGPDGRWWGINERGALMVIAAGWLTRQAFAVQEGVRLSAIAVESRSEEIYVLDDRERSVLALAHDGVLRRRIGSFSQPSDLAVDRRGACYVADQGLGGVIVYEADGRYRCRLGREGEGKDAFSTLRRIALGAGEMLYCLDSEQFLVQRFDRYHRRLESWTVQGDRDNPPVDLAAHPMGLLVLLSDGTLLVFNQNGVASRALPPLSETGLFERLGTPSSVSVDAGGMVLVTYPDDGLVVRYNRAGEFSGVRGTALWEQLTRFTVDGAGGSYGLSDDTGLISAFDAEGWLRFRVGGTERYGGPFERAGALAATHDGRYLYALDERRICVMRFDLTQPQSRPLIFGQEGENAGQFDEPVALAVDDEDRCYVLDAGLHRVSVFDLDGRFRYEFGHHQRGNGRDELIEPTRIAVSPQGDFAYVYDADRYEVMKFALDGAAGKAEHINNTGGRGRELGQFYEVTGLGCDRLGLLYVLDARREDLQVLDFRGNNAVTLLASELEKLGIGRAEGFGLAADGLPWVAGDEAFVGLRWSRK